MREKRMLPVEPERMSTPSFIEYQKEANLLIAKTKPTKWEASIGGTE